MNDEHEDDLLHGLSALDVDAATAERIRLRARAELARAAAPTPIRRAAGRVVRRAELVVVGALAASYLMFALRAALVPFQ
ncbi:MAG TPA: hypothetical protein VMZ28_17655 [Kofleriaceae bacterium]|nr:hypothetical protein [Kofleriaceae bacterium]